MSKTAVRSRVTNAFLKKGFWRAGKRELTRVPLLILAGLALVLPCFGGGWYVGNTSPGEWIQYQHVWLTNGHYRFTARAGTVTNGAAFHLEIDGTILQQGVAVPNTGRPDSFATVHLGSMQVSQGYHDLRVVFETPGVSLDWFMLRKDNDSTPGVKESDITMVRPSTDDMLIAPVVGFEHHEDQSAPPGSPSAWVPNINDLNGHPFSDYQLKNWYGVPMYRDFDRRSDRYWDILVDELVASRAQVPLIHCRETADFTHDLQDRAYSPGGGWYEGRWLKKFSEAVARNPQAASSLKIGMLWESGGIASGFYDRFGFYPGWGTPGFVDYIMQYWLAPWFDNIPSELLYQPTPSRPIISFWASTPDSIVRDGKMGDFMMEIRKRMQAKYGLDPLIVLPVGGCVDAPALAQAWGQASWVTWDGPLFTSNYFSGTYWGTASSGSRRRIDTIWMNDWDPVTNTGTPAGTESPGHDSHQPRLDTNGNSVFWNALNQAKNLGTRFVQEEGFYNISEGNSIFRSCHPEWKYPNQHLGVMREFADPDTQSLMFEAEGCDLYYKTATTGNRGGTYRNQWYSTTDLDVYRPLHNAQGWMQKSPGSATFVQIDAGFFDVWALDVNGQVWAQPINGFINAWQALPGSQKFTSISVGKLYAWGINGNTVYSTSLPNPANAQIVNGWNQRSGSMVQLDVGATEVWAVNPSGQVFRRPVDGSGDWTQVSGTMDKISVGDAFVWGLRSGHIYFSLTSSTNVSWTECPNPYNLVQLHVGSDEVWGVDVNGHVFRKSASGVGDWDLMDGNLTSLCLGENYVWGLMGSIPRCRKLEGFAQAGVALAPFSPRATATNGQVALVWTASSSAVSYNVKRATTSGGPYSTLASEVTASFIDSNVVNGTTYYYALSAVNPSGESINSTEATAMPQAAPVAPVNLTATAVSATQIDLAWTNSLASGIKIERKTGASGTYSEIQRAPGSNVSAFSDRDVAFSTQYYYRVRAYNAGGDSAYSSEVNVTTPVSQGGTGSGTIIREVWTNIPGASVAAIPTNTTPNFTYALTSLEGPTNWGDKYGARIRGYITAPSSGSYTFWIASDDNSELWLSTDTQPANKVKIAAVTGWTSPHAWNNSSSQRSPAIFLNGGLKYYVEVLHKEDGGNDNLAVGWAKPGEDTSIPSQVIPGSQLSPFATQTGFIPAAPSALIATAVSGVQINLSWTDNATNEDRIKIERKIGASGTYTQVGEVGGGVTHFNDTGFLPITDYYYYRVRAANAGGDSAYSSDASAMPLPCVPLRPDNLVAVSGSSSQINLVWADNANNETGFQIERKTGSGGAYSQLATVGAGITSFNDAGLPASATPYYYRVRANNAIGSSVYSNEAEAATLPSADAPPPPGVLAAIAGDAQVALVWSAFSGASAYNVKRSTTSGGPYTTIQSGVAATSFEDMSVTNGIRYYYVVSGVSAGNEGINSMESSATPSVPPVYTNTVAGNWNSVTWLPNPPGKPSPGNQTAIIFANSASINSTNDLGNFTLNQLLFANQNVSLAGSPLTFDGAAPSVTSTQNCLVKIATPLNFSQNTAFIIGSNATTLSGGISGVGGLNKLGAGTLVLLGTNTYTGGTMVYDGILQLGDGVNNGLFTGSIINNSPAIGGVTFNNGTTQTNSTVISSCGSVVKTGSGTLTWILQEAYTGATIINGGTIISSSGVNGLGVNWSPVNINSNAIWSVNGITASVGTLTLNNGICGVNRSGNIIYSNVVSFGSSTIGVSEFRMGSVAGNPTGIFNVVDGTLTVYVNQLRDNNGVGRLVKVGNGTMVVTNVGNSYKGSTIISNGILQVSKLANGGVDSHIGQSSSAATSLVINGGTLKYAGAAVSSDRLFCFGVNGATLDASGSGALLLNNAGPVGFVDTGNHALTLTGTGVSTLTASLSDNGGATALVKTGTGGWTLGGNNTFSGGTTVSGGTLTVSATATLGVGNLTVNSGAICLMQNASSLAAQAYVYLSGNGTINLANTGTTTVARLYIGGVLQPAGVWNASRNAAHFAGAGSLNVTGGSATGPIVLNASAFPSAGMNLSWTNSAADLFYTLSLTPPVVWLPVTNQSIFSNNQWSVVLPVTTNRGTFYRLQQ